MTEPEFEYALEWVDRSGRVYVGGIWTRAAAERTLAIRTGDGLYPQPVRLMRRPVAGWLPVPLQPGTAK